MTVLCYHSVTRGWDNPVSVETADFDQHCSHLARRGSTVPLAAIRDRLAADGVPPRGATVLTFDDGFADYAEHAVPIMGKYRLPATMYVVAGSLRPGRVPVNWVTGLDPADAPDLLSGDQVRDLHERGWEIGSHSMVHADLSTLSEAECLADLSESRELLSDLLRFEVLTLAYPYGRHTAHVRSAARRAGYTCALALPDKPEPAGPFAVPRVGIYRGNRAWKFAAKTSGWYAEARTSSWYQRMTAMTSAVRTRPAR